MNVIQPNKYDIKVADWLREHGITFGITATGFRQGFSDDDDNDKSYHDTYHATFERAGSGRFVERFDVDNFKQSAAHSRSNIERTRCTNKCGVAFGETFRHKDACAANPKNTETPTAYDILSCITKSDPGTFRDFCGDYGYDEDSMRANRIYLAVQKEYASAAKFFTAEELDELQEIES